MKKSKLFLLASSCVWCICFLSHTSTLLAQSYFVSQVNEDYWLQFDTPVDVTISEESTVEVPIGFDFTFFGNSYSTCHISENGFLQFGEDPYHGCCQGQPLPSAGIPNNLIAAAWMNNYPGNCCSGGGYYAQFQYETMGNAPDRVFIVTFDLTESCSAYYFGQVKLFEGTNVIEIHTDSYADGDTPCSSVTQGIENSNGTEGFYYEGRNANVDWNVPCCGDMIRFLPASALPENDAGVDYVFNNPQCVGTFPIEVIVKNHGLNPLESVSVDWTSDGNPQSSVTIPFSPPLPHGASYVVEIGAQTYAPGESYNIIAWTYLPNGVTDDNPSNDVYATTITTGVKDTFTIGGTSPDFDSFSDAIEFLQTTGVCDTTWMLVRPGTYTEQIVVPWIPGAANSRVIFAAENGDSTSVVLQYEPTEEEMYVVQFYNTSGITFERMTINVLGTLIGRGFQLSLHCFNNTIQNCAINGINTTATSRDFACICSQANNPDNQFNNNLIRFGSVSVYHEIFDDGIIIGLQEGRMSGQRGSSSGPFVPGLEVRNNVMEEFSYAGVVAIETDSIVVEQNMLSSSKDRPNGLYIQDDIGAYQLTGNTILLPGGRYGLALYTNQPPSDTRPLVANNIIYVNHDSEQVRGLYASNSFNTDFIHNTIKISGTDASNAALEIEYMSGDSLFNNLLASYGAGAVFNIGSFDLSMSDYNGFYHESNILGVYDYAGAQVDDLEEWIALSGFETHSLYYPPYFLDTDDLHLGNSYFNGKATSDWMTLHDIDGDLRNTSYPDIGADEFDPMPLDLSVVGMISPSASCDSLQEVKVALINLGTSTVTSADVHWVLNGEIQNPVNFSGNLSPEGDTVHITLGTDLEFDDQVDSLIFWADNVNGDEDMFSLNDTLFMFYSIPVNGEYTIGGTNPDFPSIAAAYSFLEEYGVCGPVTLLLRDGIYNEQLSIGEIPGTSAEHQVTLTSESQDSSLVTIQFDASVDSNYIIRLDGAKFLKFENVKFKTIHSTYANLCLIESGSQMITFSNCEFEGRNPSLPFGNSYLVFAGAGMEGKINFTNNYFLNGTRAVYLFGNGLDPVFADSIRLQNNRFVNQRNGAILLQNLRDISITGGTIASNSTASYTGISLSQCHGTNLIERNRIHLTSSGDGISLSAINGDSNDEGNCTVSNNMASVVSGSAFEISGSRRILFTYNSAYSAGTNASSHHGLSVGGGDSLVFLNNILVANSGRAYNESYYTPYINADHNCFFTSGPELAYRANIAYTDLADWQSGTLLDSHSVEVDPQFISSSDLHVLNTSLNGLAIPIPDITQDIDGQIRDVINPDIGADEIGTEPDDAGLLAILPEMPFARGWQDVKAVIRNFGSDTIYTAVVSWEWNSVPQPDYYYSGELQSLADDTIVLGAIDFELANAYQFSVWTSLPNGVVDGNTVNDTLNQDAIYPAASGEIIVGATGEVTSITSAVNAIALGGLIDGVQFKIQSGNYHESVSFDTAPFLQCGAQVEFTSLTGNAADVIWDNMGTGTHTLQFNGADGILVHHLTIKSVVNAMQAIRFQNASDCNVIENCIVEGVTTTSTSASYAVISGISTSTATYNINNLIQHNVISKGSIGVYWDGYSGTPGLRVQQNTFQNTYASGMHLYRMRAPIVSKNTVSTTSTISNYVGINIDFCQDNVTVADNQILLHGKRAYGIYFNSSNGTASLISRVVNNYVILGQGANSYGIYTNNSSYINVLHNTIRISGGANTGINILRNQGGNTQYLNNILDNQANGRTMQFNGSNTPLTSNYNTHFTDGTNVVTYLGTNYSTLTAWQATGRDVNSQWVEPVYTEEAPLGYKIINAEMNGTAFPGTNTYFDIEGTSRDTLTPDIGCDEFNLFTDDVGLLSISYPKIPFPSGLNTVYVKFINNGVDTLTSMVVNWEVDGELQPMYLWTGLLPSAGTYDSLDIGEFNFSPSVYHTIKVWVSDPNEVPDQLATNDTLMVDSLYPGLYGILTIGGVDPDFESISQAVTELNRGGASGPITFNIRSGTYLDTILIHDFPGSDCDRPVIFQSETGDSSDVLITNLGLDQHTIRLDGADGVTFQNLHIVSVNPAFRHVVHYANGAHCNQFIGNTLTGYQSTSGSNSAAVIMSPAGLDTQNVFAGNLIKYGSFSFYLYGNTSDTSGTIIADNILELPHYIGIYVRNESHLTIVNNQVASLPGGNIAVNLYLCHHVRQVSGNRIRLPGGGYGIIMDECDNVAASPGFVFNNMISLGGTHLARGIYIVGSSYQQVLHNNVHVYSTSAAGSHVVPLYLNGCPSIKVYNNICSNIGSGYAIFSTNNTNIQSDYNDFYYQGSTLGYWNGAFIADLEQWRTATGQDQHSLALDPQFMSYDDLHISNVLLNGVGLDQPSVLQDYDGDLRLSPPDIGADEFDPSIPHDAGVFMYLGPQAPFAHGVQPIECAIKNFGTDTLTSVNVRWIVNGVEQPMYVWNGALPTAQCDTVIIGTFHFPEYTGQQFIIWTEFPNNIPDSTNTNDTIEIHNIYPALHGTYTVGGVLPDFNLFSQVEHALNYGGILGDVEFSIRDGIYNTQLNIQNFPRLVHTHKVTFTSASSDSTSVEITRQFWAPEALNFTIKLNNAHGVYFKDLTLGSTKGRILEISNGSSRIEVSHCRLSGVPLTANFAGFQLIYSTTSTEDSLWILNNVFENGDHGIYLIGSAGDFEKNITITGNTFINQYNHSISTRYTEHLLVQYNSVRNTQHAQNGMVIGNAIGNVVLSNNDIRLLAGGSFPFYIYGSTGTLEVPIQINNNYILGGNWNGAVSGMGQDACNHIRYAYNTVRVEDSSPSTVAFRDNNSMHNIHLRNCIFSNEGGGKAMHTDWSHYYTTNTYDYCNLYTNGPVLSYCFVDYETLSLLQSETGLNLHGVSVESLFSGEGPELSQAALNGAATPVSGLTTDIYGDQRMVLTPDIGAREFILPDHDIGIKLLLAPETYCGFGSEEIVSIRIQNYGANPETGFNVSFKLNENSWVTENIGSLVVQPGGVLDFNFNATVDLSQVGTYIFSASCDLSTDLLESNDTLSAIEVVHIPALVASPTNLIPADNAVDLNITVSLSWAPVPNATLYDLYVWRATDPEPPTPQVANLVNINRNFTLPFYGETYQWKVVAKNSCNQMMASSIQSFIVRFLPDLTVDTVIAPIASYTGQPIEINWVVKNEGTGSTQAGLWSDAIYMSSDATLNHSLDIYLGSVQNLTALQPGESYAQEATFTVPNYTVGNYYIFVHSDRYTSIVETDNNNNWTRSAVVSMIELSPLPDLDVTTVSAPDLAFSGQQINLLYTVTNEGTASTGLKTWHDRIYLTTDPNNPTGHVLGTVVNTADLLPDSSYTKNLVYTIPPSLFGDYFIHVVTDLNNVIYEFAAEANNKQRSDSIEILLTPPADFVITGLDIPDTISTGYHNVIKWTVNNQGAGPSISAYWKDQWYISPAPVYNQNFNIPLANKFQKMNVLSQEDYTTSAYSASINIPAGWYYLYGYTDILNYEYEHNMEANNIYAHPVLAFVANTDLKIGEPVYPDTIHGNTHFVVNWSQINSGGGRYANKRVNTKIYGSNSPEFNPSTALLLSSEIASGQSMMGVDTISKGTSILCPPSLSGEVYLHWVINDNQMVFESTGDSNNIFTIPEPIHVIGPPLADLEVVTFVRPDTVTAGIPWAVQYATKNSGTKVNELPWKDEVYISFDSIWMPEHSIKLADLVQNKTLDPADTTHTSVLMTLPTSFTENYYYIYVKSDKDNVLFEGPGENNNIERSSAFYVQGVPRVDLGIDTVILEEGPYISGRTFDITWVTSVRNDKTPVVLNWKDHAFLSTDLILDTLEDIRVGLYSVSSVNMNFGPDQPLTHEGVISIPINVSGTFYLIVQSDFTELHFDTIRENNISKLHNENGDPMLIQIELAPLPDLFVSTLQAPSTVITGQVFEVAMCVTNIGTGNAAVQWQNQLYLSTDPVIGSGDLHLTTFNAFAQNQPVLLQPDSSKCKTSALVIPAAYGGNYYLIARTDAYNGLFELTGETNNTTIREIEVVPPPPSDLVIESILLPQEAIAGEVIEIEWSTRNSGLNPAYGQYREIVYLSTDTLWSVDDPVFGIKDTTGYIPPLTTIQNTMSGQVKDVVEGQYYAVVQTDARQQITESDESNNISASLDPLTVDLKRLMIDSLTLDTLRNDQELYYKIVILPGMEGESMVISLQGDSATGLNELYGKFGSIPSRGDFEFNPQQASGPFQHIIIPSLQVGTYYIVGYGAMEFGNPQPVELLARIVPYQIHTISPDVGVKDTRVTVEIKGIKLDQSEKFRLRQNAPWIECVAENIFIFNENLVYATFDLTGMPVDTYTIEGVRPDSSLAWVENGFRVIEEGISELQVDAFGQGSIWRWSRTPTKIVVTFLNSGDIDIENAIVVVEAPSGNLIAPSLELLYGGHGSPECEVLLTEPNGPPGILRPGASGTIEVFAWTLPGPSFVVGLKD